MSIVFQILSSLEIYRHRPRLNSPTLGLMHSTLTTIPPRETSSQLLKTDSIYGCAQLQFRLRDGNLSEFLTIYLNVTSWQIMLLFCKINSHISKCMLFLTGIM
jgi:hypothetical protein